MNAIPKRYLSTGELKPTLPSDQNSVVIECEVVQPPSMEGRTIYVHLRDEEIEHFLKEFRDAAISRRSRPMSEVS